MPKRKFEDDKLIELYIDQDLSSIKIAKIFGVRVSSVCRRLGKLGLIKPATGADGRNGKKGPVYHKGYPMVYAPEHPKAKSNGYVREHIIVAEQCLGRPLTAKEVIHHIDEDKTNNKSENLLLFPNHASHMRFHWRLRKAEVRKWISEIMDALEVGE